MRIVHYLTLKWNVLYIMFYDFLVNIFSCSLWPIVNCIVNYMLNCIVSNDFFLDWYLLKYVDFFIISNCPLKWYLLYPLSSLHLLNLTFIWNINDLAFRWNIWSSRSLKLNPAGRARRAICNLVARWTIRSREVGTHLLLKAHYYLSKDTCNRIILFFIKFFIDKLFFHISKEFTYFFRTRLTYPSQIEI